MLYLLPGNAGVMTVIDTENMNEHGWKTYTATYLSTTTPSPMPSGFTPTPQFYDGVLKDNQIYMAPYESDTIAIF
jgi:hypothetical protein